MTFKYLYFTSKKTLLNPAVLSTFSQRKSTSIMKIIKSLANGKNYKKSCLKPPFRPKTLKFDHVAHGQTLFKEMKQNKTNKQKNHLRLKFSGLINLQNQ